MSGTIQQSASGCSQSLVVLLFFSGGEASFFSFSYLSVGIRIEEEETNLDFGLLLPLLLLWALNIVITHLILTIILLPNQNNIIV